MARFITISLAALAVLLGQTAASPIESAVNATALEQRAAQRDFSWRFYDYSSCNHGAPAGNTWPRNDKPPFDGSTNICYSAPTGTDWRKLEVNEDFFQITTFCNVNCENGSWQQTGTYCYSAPGGCAIGSFMAH